MGDEEKQIRHSVDAATNVDIDALVMSMETKICRPPNIYSKACIFKTPEMLLRHNKEAYLPNAFSIGPFHHGQPKLLAAQEIKLYYLHGLLSRRKNLRDLIEAVAEIEGEARACYAATVTFTKEEFTEMLVLDGCFLIELFRLKYGEYGSVEEDDPVLKVPSMLQCLYHDLVLLENQVPWFVLQRLYSMTTTIIINNGDEYDDPLIEIVKLFFCLTFSSSAIPTANPTFPCAHILYLLRETLILSTIFKVDSMTAHKSLYPGAHCTFPSATSLVEAGVKFRKQDSEEGEEGEWSNSILKIKFDSDRGVLEMSPFLIQNTTEATFKNLISLEQCYPHCKPVITSYLMLLDDLIDTSKDLKILIDKGIISGCCLDAEDATRVFNGLHNDCYVAEFYYTDLCSVHRGKHVLRAQMAEMESNVPAQLFRDSMGYCFSSPCCSTPHFRFLANLLHHYQLVLVYSVSS